MLVDNFATPYYAVIFSSVKTPNIEGYAEMAERMWQLAAEQEGFLGADSASDEKSITVSYWQSLEAIKQWRHNVKHAAAQKLGREQWYAQFRLRIAKVEKNYGMG
ncbi:MAG: antibiotic biosynthesis monooxygenase [Alteromonadaceae bacterium]|nr:antibiotic biosynthesis monooxygenase [Alteromonadaceae bacterium]